LPPLLDPAPPQMEAGLLRGRRWGRSGRRLQLPQAVGAEAARADGGAAPLTVQGVRVTHQLQPTLPEKAPDLIRVHAGPLAHLTQVGLGVLPEVGAHPVEGFGLLLPAVRADRAQPAVHQVAATNTVAQGHGDPILHVRTRSFVETSDNPAPAPASGVTAKVSTSTRRAPASRRVRAASRQVAPVVSTSSTRRIRRPLTLFPSVTTKAFFRFRRRAASSSPTWGRVGRRRRSTSAARGRPMAAATGRAKSSL